MSRMYRPELFNSMKNAYLHRKCVLLILLFYTWYNAHQVLYMCSVCVITYLCCALFYVFDEDLRNCVWCAIEIFDHWSPLSAFYWNVNCCECCSLEFHISTCYLWNDGSASATMYRRFDPFDCDPALTRRLPYDVHIYAISMANHNSSGWHSGNEFSTNFPLKSLNFFSLLNWMMSNQMVWWWWYWATCVM